MIPGRDKEGKVVKVDSEAQPIYEGQSGVIIPVIEEHVTVEKKLVEKGKVVISKKVHSEETDLEIPLDTEHLHIEHIPINRYLDTAPPPFRHEGNTIIIPVIQEVMIKKILLVEEIRVTNEVSTTLFTEKINLKREEVTITRKDN